MPARFINISGDLLPLFPNHKSPFRFNLHTLPKVFVLFGFYPREISTFVSCLICILYSKSWKIHRFSIRVRTTNVVPKQALPYTCQTPLALFVLNYTGVKTPTSSFSFIPPISHI